MPHNSNEDATTEEHVNIGSAKATIMPRKRGDVLFCSAGHLAQTNFRRQMETLKPPLFGMFFHWLLLVVPLCRSFPLNTLFDTENANAPLARCFDLKFDANTVWFHSLASCDLHGLLLTALILPLILLVLLLVTGLWLAGARHRG